MQSEEADERDSCNSDPVISLVILDASRVFGEALAARLGSDADMRVLRVATSADALLGALGHSPVDVVICDVVLFDSERLKLELTGVSGSERRDGHGASVVVLADHDDGHLLGRAVRAGARGWVPRDASADDLTAAVRAVATGGTWIPPKVLTRLLDELTELQTSTQKILATLTPREREVLTCLSEGLNRMEVASRLRLSTNTVRTHVQAILSKLNVNSSVAAVALMRKAKMEAAGRLETTGSTGQ
jgi:DNA-binding NarL/FixJ family response regulator